jgi:cytochrome d ubiquinol oxidase subunit II
MPDLWYALAALLLTAYVVLAGFDLGAGALHVVVARTDDERRTVISAVGPFWHGNEVWILAAGGTLLLAFPIALASALSGFYLGIFFAVWALMLRGASIELRNHAPSDLWHAFWDAILSLTSATYVLLLGVVLGNLLRGVPLEASGTFSMPLFGGGAGLIDAYTAAVGAFALVSLGAHGATFLAWKADGEAAARAAKVAGFAWPITLVAWGALFAATRFVAGFGPRGEAWALVFVAAAAAIAATVLVRRGKQRAAFIASCTFFAANMLGIAASLHPTILRSLDGRDLRVVDAASDGSGLRIAAWWWCLAFILAALYAANTFRLQRGRAKPGDH